MIILIKRIHSLNIHTRGGQRLCLRNQKSIGLWSLGDVIKHVLAYSEGQIKNVITFSKRLMHVKGILAL